jgi:excisionase family DNA binding protein
MSAATKDRLMTPIELAEYLQIPIGTLYMWNYRREGPLVHKIGRHLRYRLSEVDAWVLAR